MIDYGAYVRSARKSLDASRIRFGVMIGASPYTVRDWEIGVRPPSPPYLMVIEMKTGIKPEHFRTADGETMNG